jgi:catechol 2,3-dioxygenase-like lactoylglutathione lyase family enzyme
MSFHIRIARPVTDLDRSVGMYVLGLGLNELARFDDHAGFDGVMLGRPGMSFHFEFTRSKHAPMAPSPTREDLLVIYLPNHDEWAEACDRMVDAGFAEAPSFNPYWEQRGRTFVDPDGYRVVLEQDHWATGGHVR